MNIQVGSHVRKPSEPRHWGTVLCSPYAEEIVIYYKNTTVRMKLDRFILEGWLITTDRGITWVDLNGVIVR